MSNIKSPIPVVLNVIHRNPFAVEHEIRLSLPNDMLSNFFLEPGELDTVDIAKIRTIYNELMVNALTPEKFRSNGLSYPTPIPGMGEILDWFSRTFGLEIYLGEKGIIKYLHPDPILRSITDMLDYADSRVNWVDVLTKTNFVHHVVCKEIILIMVAWCKFMVSMVTKQTGVLTISEEVGHDVLSTWMSWVNKKDVTGRKFSMDGTGDNGAYTLIYE